ncbi:MAG TPA: type II toxin-antitoxin system Phd/YefM family antitoxin [Thermoanaerobaculia bacterium]|nr:type II toxin-antitoxin system Phd/YefM family antitoxin [Thermoanaerobaculia bacterium]
MKRLDVLDLPEDARDLIRECEAKGTRTLFERNGRPVAVLVSHDEYLALRETIEIANDSLLFARLASADEEEVEQRGRYEWLRFAKSAAPIFDAGLRRIELDPICGAPLFEPLKGLWSYRTEKLRIIYKIVAEARMVVILAIERI